jgi:hypothetical protein
MSGMINEFKNYCMQNKTRTDLSKLFYGSLGVNAKECKMFKLTSEEWRYVIRVCLHQKTKERSLQHERI